MEGSQNINENNLFIYPVVEKEVGEIERVAKEFDLKKSFVSDFIERSRNSQIVELSENDWEKLENTDSFTIAPSDWDAVAKVAVDGHPDHPRDWKGYKLRMEKFLTMDAPIIVRIGETLHLVSGNTRLMVARALKINPKVLIVDMN